MTSTRTSIFRAFGLTDTHGCLRFHASNTVSKGGGTYEDQLRKDGRNAPYILVSATAMRRAAGASWFLATAKGLDKRKKDFLNNIVTQGAPLTRVHGYGNGKWANGQALAAKRA